MMILVSQNIIDDNNDEGGNDKDEGSNVTKEVAMIGMMELNTIVYIMKNHLYFS